MKRYLKHSITILAAAATMLSCSQSHKPTHSASNATADSLSAMLIPSDSLVELKRNYIDGYVFVYNVYCESQDKKEQEWVRSDWFCSDNYEFSLLDCFSFLRDSDDVLYYCPPVQDDIPLSVFMTKDQFRCATKAVRAYYDAPDTWVEGQEYIFVHRDHDDFKRIKKIRVQDPEAVMIRDGSGKMESLYGRSVYAVDGYIFCEEQLEVEAPSSLDHSLTISDSGYFGKVDDKTGKVKPTSRVEMCREIPDLSCLFFLDDSTVVVNQTVYHRVEMSDQVIFDSNSPFVPKEVPVVDMSQYTAGFRSAGTYTVTSDGGRYEYEIQLWKDTCDEDLDFIVFNKLLILSENQVKASVSDEFDWLGDSHYKADASHPFYTFSLENGCTLLMFQMNGRPNLPSLLVYALKEGTVTTAYCEEGQILSIKNEDDSVSFHLQSRLGEHGKEPMKGVETYYSPDQYCDLYIKDGKIILRDFK